MQIGSLPVPISPCSDTQQTKLSEVVTCLNLALSISMHLRSTSWGLYALKPRSCICIMNAAEVFACELCQSSEVRHADGGRAVCCRCSVGAKAVGSVQGV